MTESDIEALEAMLADMSDQDVARFYNSLECEDPRCDIVAGECERRHIDL